MALDDNGLSKVATTIKEQFEFVTGYGGYAKPLTLAIKTADADLETKASAIYNSLVTDSRFEQARTLLSVIFFLKDNPQYRALSEKSQDVIEGENSAGTKAKYLQHKPEYLLDRLQKSFDDIILELEPEYYNANDVDIPILGPKFIQSRFAPIESNS